MNRNNLLVMLCLVFFAGIIIPQPSSGNVVEIKVKAPKLVSADKEINAEVTIKIADGWHINSNKPLDDNLSPTVVSLKKNPDIDIKSITYPQPVITKLQFSQSQMSLFEDEAVVKIRFIINKSFRKNALKLEGEVQYQPCNNQTCLFPASKPFTIDLRIKK